MSCITHIRCTSLSLNLTPHLPRMLPIVAVGFIAIVVPLPAHEFFVRPPGGVHVPPSILGPPFPNLHPKRLKKNKGKKNTKKKNRRTRTSSHTHHSSPTHQNQHSPCNTYVGVVSQRKMLLKETPMTTKEANKKKRTPRQDVADKDHKCLKVN